MVNSLGLMPRSTSRQVTGVAIGKPGRARWRIHATRFSIATGQLQEAGTARVSFSAADTDVDCTGTQRGYSSSVLMHKSSPSQAGFCSCNWLTAPQEFGSERRDFTPDAN